MERKLGLKIGSGMVLFFILLMVLMIAVESYEEVPRNRESRKKEIYLFDETTLEILNATQKAFPEYELKKEKERHLAKFLEGKDIIMAYDIQALPLVDEKRGPYFYPLYEDIVVIATDKKQVYDKITDWKDLTYQDYIVNVPNLEPTQRYIWQAVSYGLKGTLEKEAAQDYFSTLYQQRKLNWDNWLAPVHLTLHSTYVHSLWQRRELDIIYPEGGTISFQVGFLSHQELPQKQLEELRKAYRERGYLPLHYSAENLRIHNQKILPSVEVMKDLINYGEINTRLTRKVKQNMKYAPINGIEHHAAALILIIVIIFGVSIVHKTVIHLGVKKGMTFTAALLICWIVVGVFKYSFYGSAVYLRALWYSYYIFILMLPPTGLYIANNINQFDKSLFPQWLKAAWVISAVLLIMVLTNDFHQFVFRFLVSDKNLWHKFYSRNWGYYLVAFWMVFTQIGAWIYLLKKSWNSPRRKIGILPVAVIVLGIIYSLFYNLQVPFFRNISLALGMSSIVTMFWAAALKSGLIPSNHDYQNLFENSQLDMQILDEKGKLCFSSAGSDWQNTVFQAPQNKEYPFFVPEEDSLIWSTSISGGTIVSKENIQKLTALKKDLENVTKELEDENSILSKKEQVKSRLIFIKEQNNLTEEVNLVVEDKIQKMQNLIGEMKERPQEQKKDLIELQRLAIYCKRRCELFIKSKQKENCEDLEMNRLMDEVNALYSKDFRFFNTIHDDLTYSMAVQIYEFHHLVCELLSHEDIRTMTARLLKEKQDICLSYLLEEKEEQIEKRIRQIPQIIPFVSFKNLGDAYSMSLCLREGEYYGRIV